MHTAALLQNPLVVAEIGSNEALRDVGSVLEQMRQRANASFPFVLCPINAFAWLKRAERICKGRMAASAPVRGG
jgi:hypothetical protein